MNISGNTIFIPGGTSGLGLGLALRFQDAGNTVIVAGRREQLLEQIKLDHPGIATFVIDTADAASIESTAREVQEKFPATNVLINMAGIMLPEDYHTADFLSVAESTVATNLLGPIRLIAAFSEFLAGQPDATIINVSSGLAFVPLPYTPTYNATKAAIHLLSEGIRVQLSDTTVKVMELVPPAVRTSLMGQENADNAMPVDDFLSQVIDIIRLQPDAREILVENVKYLRFAEVRGDYDGALRMLAGH